MPFELNWQTDKKVAKFIETSSFLVDPLLKVEEALNKYTDITPNSTWQDINNHIISLHKKLSHPNTRTELTKQLTGIAENHRDLTEAYWALRSAFETSFQGRLAELMSNNVYEPGTFWSKYPRFSRLGDELLSSRSLDEARRIHAEITHVAQYFSSLFHKLFTASQNYSIGILQALHKTEYIFRNYEQFGINGVANFDNLTWPRLDNFGIALDADSLSLRKYSQWISERASANLALTAEGFLTPVRKQPVIILTKHGEFLVGTPQKAEFNAIFATVSSVPDSWLLDLGVGREHLFIAARRRNERIGDILQLMDETANNDDALKLRQLEQQLENAETKLTSLEDIFIENQDNVIYADLHNKWNKSLIIVEDMQGGGGSIVEPLPPPFDGGTPPSRRPRIDIDSGPEDWSNIEDNYLNRVDEWGSSPWDETRSGNGIRTFYDSTPITPNKYAMSALGDSRDEIRPSKHGGSAGGFKNDAFGGGGGIDGNQPLSHFDSGDNVIRFYAPRGLEAHRLDNSIVVLNNSFGIHLISKGALTKKEHDFARHFVLRVSKLLNKNPNLTTNDIVNAIRAESTSTLTGTKFFVGAEKFATLSVEQKYRALLELSLVSGPYKQLAQPILYLFDKHGMIDFTDALYTFMGQRYTKKPLEYFTAYVNKINRQLASATSPGWAAHPIELFQSMGYDVLNPEALKRLPKAVGPKEVRTLDIRTIGENVSRSTIPEKLQRARIDELARRRQQIYSVPDVHELYDNSIQVGEDVILMKRAEVTSRHYIQNVPPKQKMTRIAKLLQDTPPLAALTALAPISPLSNELISDAPLRHYLGEDTFLLNKTRNLGNGDAIEADSDINIKKHNAQQLGSHIDSITPDSSPNQLANIADVESMARKQKLARQIRIFDEDAISHIIENNKIKGHNFETPLATRQQEVLEAITNWERHFQVTTNIQTAAQLNDYAKAVLTTQYQVPENLVDDVWRTLLETPIETANAIALTAMPEVLPRNNMSSAIMLNNKFGEHYPLGLGELIIGADNFKPGGLSWNILHHISVGQPSQGLLHETFEQIGAFGKIFEKSGAITEMTQFLRDNKPFLPKNIAAGLSYLRASYAQSALPEIATHVGVNALGHDYTNYVGRFQSTAFPFYKVASKLGYNLDTGANVPEGFSSWIEWYSSVLEEVEKRGYTVTNQILIPDEVLNDIINGKIVLNPPTTPKWRIKSVEELARITRNVPVPELTKFLKNVNEPLIKAGHINRYLGLVAVGGTALLAHGLMSGDEEQIMGGGIGMASIGPFFGKHSSDEQKILESLKRRKTNESPLALRLLVEKSQKELAPETLQREINIFKDRIELIFEIVKGTQLSVPIDTGGRVTFFSNDIGSALVEKVARLDNGLAYGPNTRESVIRARDKVFGALGAIQEAANTIADNEGKLERLRMQLEKANLDTAHTRMRRGYESVHRNNVDAIFNSQASPLDKLKMLEPIHRQAQSTLSTPLSASASIGVPDYLGQHTIVRRAQQISDTFGFDAVSKLLDEGSISTPEALRMMTLGDELMYAAESVALGARQVLRETEILASEVARQLNSDAVSRTLQNYRQAPITYKSGGKTIHIYRPTDFHISQHKARNIIGLGVEDKISWNPRTKKFDVVSGEAFDRARHSSRTWLEYDSKAREFVPRRAGTKAAVTLGTTASSRARAMRDFRWDIFPENAVTRGNEALWKKMGFAGGGALIGLVVLAGILIEKETTQDFTITQRHINNTSDAAISTYNTFDAVTSLYGYSSTVGNFTSRNVLKGWLETIEKQENKELTAKDVKNLSNALASTLNEAKTYIAQEAWKAAHGGRFPQQGTEEYGDFQQFMKDGFETYKDKDGATRLSGPLWNRFFTNDRHGIEIQEGEEKGRKKISLIDLYVRKEQLADIAKLMDEKGKSLIGALNTVSQVAGYMSYDVHKTITQPKYAAYYGKVSDFLLSAIDFAADIPIRYMLNTLETFGLPSIYGESWIIPVGDMDPERRPQNGTIVGPPLGNENTQGAPLLEKLTSLFNQLVHVKNMNPVDALDIVFANVDMELSARQSADNWLQALVYKEQAEQRGQSMSMQEAWEKMKSMSVSQDRDTGNINIAQRWYEAGIGDDITSIKNLTKNATPDDLNAVRLLKIILSSAIDASPASNAYILRMGSFSNTKKLSSILDWRFYKDDDSFAYSVPQRRKIVPHFQGHYGSFHGNQVADSIGAAYSIQKLIQEVYNFDITRSALLMVNMEHELWKKAKEDDKTFAILLSSIEKAQIPLERVGFNMGDVELYFYSMYNIDPEKAWNEWKLLVYTETILYPNIMDRTDSTELDTITRNLHEFILSEKSRRNKTDLQIILHLFNTYKDKVGMTEGDFLQALWGIYHGSVLLKVKNPIHPLYVYINELINARLGKIISNANGAITAIVKDFNRLHISLHSWRRLKVAARTRNIKTASAVLTTSAKSSTIYNTKPVVTAEAKDPLPALKQQGSTITPSNLPVLDTGQRGVPPDGLRRTPTTVSSNPAPLRGNVETSPPAPPSSKVITPRPGSKADESRQYNINLTYLTEPIRVAIYAQDRKEQLLNTIRNNNMYRGSFGIDARLWAPQHHPMPIKFDEQGLAVVNKLIKAVGGTHGAQSPTGIASNIDVNASEASALADFIRKTDLHSVISNRNYENKLNNKRTELSALQNTLSNKTPEELEKLATKIYKLIAEIKDIQDILNAYNAVVERLAIGVINKRNEANKALDSYKEYVQYHKLYGDGRDAKKSKGQWSAQDEKEYQEFLRNLRDTMNQSDREADELERQEHAANYKEKQKRAKEIQKERWWALSQRGTRKEQAAARRYKKPNGHSYGCMCSACQKLYKKLKEGPLPPSDTPIQPKEIPPGTPWWEPDELIPELGGPLDLMPTELPQDNKPAIIPIPLAKPRFLDSPGIDSPSDIAVTPVQNNPIATFNAQAALGPVAPGYSSILNNSMFGDNIIDFLDAPSFSNISDILENTPISTTKVGGGGNMGAGIMGGGAQDRVNTDIGQNKDDGSDDEPGSSSKGKNAIIDMGLQLPEYTGGLSADELIDNIQGGAAASFGASDPDSIGMTPGSTFNQGDIYKIGTLPNVNLAGNDDKGPISW